MKCKLYYHAERNLLGVNTKENLLQFSDEANFFMALTSEWEFIREIEFNNKVEGSIATLDAAGKIPAPQLPTLPVTKKEDFNDELDAVISWN